MDLDKLKSTVSNLTLYDIKAGVRSLQNAVMNYTEMEAKVREATNNEPWGASSTLMQEISNGTFNYQLLNEIMPMIYHRFTEKAAEQWRQIYKALQLLEFLIKNGSERVIDDARSHMSLLKMLRQFHFIDANGKDQGINVRNRSKELVELLSDVDKIRTERKKARSNRTKYSGYEGGGGGRFGGFGSESAGAGSTGGSYGAYSGGVYGDGGGFGGQTSDYQDTGSRRDNFEEYDEFDEGAATSGRKKHEPHSSPTSSRREGKRAAAAPAKPKEPEVDLFDFGDEPTATASTGKGPANALASLADDDDDFDDFQSAPAPAPVSNTFIAPGATTFSLPPPTSTSTTTSNTQFAAPQPRSGSQNQSINDLFASVSPPPSTNSAASSAILSPPISSISQPQARAAPGGFQSSQPNYFTSVPINPSPATSARANVATTPGGLGKPVATTFGGPAAKPSGDAFAGLLGGNFSAKKDGGTGSKLTMADMARQKASAGIWGAGNTGAAGAPKPAAPGQPQQKLGGGLDDLLG